MSVFYIGKGSLLVFYIGKGSCKCLCSILVKGPVSVCGLYW